MIKIYYRNIIDEEVLLFKGLMVPNFTIKLTDALTSGLFKVETIITDKLYKIYPLFSTESISTDNEADTVIDDLCIICTKQEDKETYITCISDENEPVQDYQNYASYYDIGDQLTTAEYNAIISMLRHSVTHSDTIRIGESYNGDYGFYEFDIEDTTVLDTGILVTDETITAEPKVKLSNPSFHFSTYTLQLSILHYTGVNIFDDDNTDYKVVDTLEIELEPDTWVPIPVETIEHGYIISFDAEVQIRHDKSEIHRLTGLSVNAQPDILQTGETSDITAQLIDYDGEPYNLTDCSGKTVYFYEAITPTFLLSANPSIIESGETSDITCRVKDSDGSLAKGVKVYFYTEVSEGVDVSLTVSSSSITIGGSVVLTATVEEDGVPVTGETVTFYDGETSLGTDTTDSDGIATLTTSSLDVGSHSITAEYDSVSSSAVTVTVNKIASTITLTGSNVNYGQSVSLSGTLSVGSGESVKIYNGSTLVDTVTTGTGGAFSKTVSGLNAGSYTFKAVYDGDSTHTNVTSSDLSITVSKLNTNLTINVPALIYSDIFDVTGTLTDSNNTALSGATVSLTWNDGTSHTETETTDANGEVTFHRSAPTSITEYSFQLVYVSTTNYNATTSSTVAKTPSKETTVLNVTSPINNSSIGVGDSVTVSGSLVTDDNEKLSGKSILVKESGTTLTTLTTDSDGAFSGTLSGLTAGTHSLVIEFETDTYYTASSVNRTVIVTTAPVPTTLSVSATKDILSYADSESSVLTATVLDQNGNAMAGQSVVFKNGSTVLDTVTTDNSGQAQYTYASAGVGDVTLTVECMSLQETYSLEDCWNAQISEVSAGSNTVNSIGMDTVHNVQNDDFCLIFDHKGNGNICIGATSEYSAPSTANYRLTLGSYNSKHYCAVRTNSTDESTGSSENNNTYYTYKIEKQGNTVSFYVDDVLWLTKTATFFSSYSSYSIYNIKWGGGTDYLKNIRLKPL